KVHLVRSAALSDARNALAASTTLAVTLPVVADTAAGGNPARCWDSAVTGNTRKSAALNAAAPKASDRAVHAGLLIRIGVPPGGRLYQLSWLGFSGDGIRGESERRPNGNVICDLIPSAFAEARHRSPLDTGRGKSTLGRASRHCVIGTLSSVRMPSAAVESSQTKLCREPWFVRSPGILWDCA